MKTVIYVWKNNSIHSSKQCDDLFQLVKTTCYLHYLSIKMLFTFHVDTQHHSISKCLPIIHPYQKIIATNKIPIVHDIDYYIQSSSNDILYFCSTTYLPHKLSTECVEFIKKIFAPSYSIMNRIQPIQVNTIIHVHINSPIISTFKYSHLLYIVYARIKKYITPTTIVLSDTQEFKTYLKTKQECMIFDTLIGNIGFPAHDDAIEDTLFDLQLMSKATKIYSFSWSNTIPGFVKLATLYNVPVIEI